MVSLQQMYSVGGGGGGGGWVSKAISIDAGIPSRLPCFSLDMLLCA